MSSSIDPKKLATFHLVMTFVWALLIIPSVIWWKSSVAWLVIMSVWANLAGHFAAWQGARGEIKQDRSSN